MAAILRVRGEDGAVHEIRAIIGPRGEPGTPGKNGTNGANGKNATINGQNTLTIEVDENLTMEQKGSVLKIGLGSVPETSSSTVAALTAAGWAEESGGGYSQTVEIPFVQADTPVVTVDVDKPGQDRDADDEAAAGFALISASRDPTQLDGALKFYTDEIPTVNVPVKVGVS